MPPPSQRAEAYVVQRFITPKVPELGLGEALANARNGSGPNVFILRIPRRKKIYAAQAPPLAAVIRCDSAHAVEACMGEGAPGPAREERRFREVP